MIKSRPLTYQLASVNDNVPLTPNHFSHGQVRGPKVVVMTLKDNAMNSEELVQHFWHQWLKEWIPSLKSSRQKWLKIKKDLKPGDCVLMIT